MYRLQVKINNVIVTNHKAENKQELENLLEAYSKNRTLTINGNVYIINFANRQ